MTNDNDNKQDQPAFYFFAYVFENSGIVQSKLGEVETRDKLNRELAALYGPDGVNLKELRPAAPEEVEEYKKSLFERYGVTPEEIEQMTQAPVDEPTIN